MRNKVMNMKKIIIICLMSIVSTIILYAANTGYNENLHTPQNMSDANAVSPQTGSLSLPFTDITLPGMNKMDLKVSRTYSSSLANVYNIALNTGNQSIITPHTPEDWKYGLGSGWTFSWPFIFGDIDDQSPVRSLKLFWAGKVYELDQSFSVDKNDNNILYYYVNDMRVSLNSSIQYTDDYTDNIAGPLHNLDVSSKYCLELKGGLKYYFSEAGNLMLIQSPGDPGDIKKAEIWFYYRSHRVIQNSDDYETNRALTKIELVVDSLGRKIDFIYKEGGENWLEEIKYNIVTAGTEVERSIKYEHTNLEEYEIRKINPESKDISIAEEKIPQADNKFSLSGFINQKGFRAKYQYGLYEAPFSFYPSFGNNINYFLNIERIFSNYQVVDAQEKYKSCMIFEYNRPLGNYVEYLRNLGSGFMSVFRVTRQYSLNKHDERFYETRYEYYGNSYGKKLTEYWTIKKSSGLNSKYVYGARDVETEDNLLKYIEVEGNNEEYLERIDFVYDIRKTLKSKSLYRSGVLKYTEEFIYDKHNDLINHKAANGLVTETRYHEKFHIPEYKIQRDVLNGDGSLFDIEKEYELRESDGKLLSESAFLTINGKRKKIRLSSITYDEYGNEKEIIDALGHSKIINYDDLYHIFPEEVVMSVTLDSGPKEIKGFKIYNSDGSVWIEADNDGYAVERIYDELGSEIKTIYPDDDDFINIGNASELLENNWRNRRANNTFTEKTINYQDEVIISYGEMYQDKRVKTGQFSDGLGHIIKNVLFENDNSENEFSVKKMTYDENGNMIAITDPGAGDTFLRRKVMGKTVDVYDKTYLIWYDDLNRKSRVEYPDRGMKIIKKTIEYNDRDLYTSTTDTLGRNTINYYDIEQNLIKLVRPGVTDENNEKRDITYEFKYNQLGQKLWMKDSGGDIIKYIFDERGLLLEQDYGSGSDMMVYDEAGNLVSKTDRNGNITRLFYDELYRNNKQQYYHHNDPDNHYDELLLSYDARGNLIKSVSNGLVEEMNYDARKRTVKLGMAFRSESIRQKLMGQLDWVTEDSEDLQKFLFEFTYTTTDLIDSMTLPNGKTVSYRYDADNLRLQNIQTPLNDVMTPVIVDMDYNRSGQVVKMEYGNETVQEWSFDLRNRIKKINAYNEQDNILELNYDVDSEGNILRINDNIFGYDEIDRIIKSEIVRLGETDYRVKVKDAFGTSIDEPGINGKRFDSEADFNDDGYIDGFDHIKACQDWTDKCDREAFTYDFNGNRRTLNKNGKDYNYFYGERNRLLKIEKAGREVFEYEYDKNGNTTKRIEYNDNTATEYEFTYDINNRLIEVKKDGEKHTGYLYNNSGLRIYKEETDSETYYFRHGGGVNFEVTAGAEGVEENSYIISGELIAGRITKKAGIEEAMYYHLDHLNSTKVITNSSGEKILAYEYTAFGTELDKVGSGKNRFSYIGREFDEEINLFYTNARYYDATTGRFINVDPIQDGYNWYTYAANNPLKLSDPYGLFTRGTWTETQAQVTVDDSKDTLWSLAESITGNGNDWKLLGISSDIKMNQVIDVSPLLDKLESRIRQNVVAATNSFNGQFPNSSEIASRAWTNGGSFSEADVNAYFTGTPPSKIDCLGAARSYLARGLILTLKSGEFDQLGYTAGNMKLKSESVGSINNMQTGDWGYIQNDTTYRSVHQAATGNPRWDGGYSGENIIKIGSGSYYGFPLGSKTYSGWQQSLVRAYNSGLPSSQHITTIPGFTGNVKFFNIPKVAMDIFDLRN